MSVVYRRVPACPGRQTVTVLTAHALMPPVASVVPYFTLRGFDDAASIDIELSSCHSSALAGAAAPSDHPTNDRRRSGRAKSSTSSPPLHHGCRAEGVLVSPSTCAARLIPPSRAPHRRLPPPAMVHPRFHHCELYIGSALLSNPRAGARDLVSELAPSFPDELPHRGPPPPVSLRPRRHPKLSRRGTPSPLLHCPRHRHGQAATGSAPWVPPLSLAGPHSRLG
jgi:hypothetical protein